MNRSRNGFGGGVVSLVASVASLGCPGPVMSVEPPECVEITEACHPLDPGYGLINDCHEWSENPVRTGAECTGRRAECLAACVPLAEMLFVASDGTLDSYDVATRAARPGSLTGAGSPGAMQALADGTILVNLGATNEVLIVDPRTLLEVTRIPTSDASAVRPVGGYVTPDRVTTEKYWLALNDGTAGVAGSSSAAFVDITPESTTRFTRAAETPLGTGHHTAAFAYSTKRVVVGNGADCSDVLSVYDYSQIPMVRSLATLTAAQAGWTAADPGPGMFDPLFCDPTGVRGTVPAPNGCATSWVSGKAYCNLTGSGQIAVVTLEAPTPAFQMVATGGSGGGATFYHPAGRYIYTVQERPREGAAGMNCQIGQLAVIDAMTDGVVAQVPLFYRGPACTDVLTGTSPESASPGLGHFRPDGNSLCILMSSGTAAGAAVDQLLVLNTLDPAAPVQLASMTVGAHAGEGAAALSGTGAFLFDVGSVAGTVSQVDTLGGTIAGTFTVQANPRLAASFGTVEGPSEQLGPIR